MIIRYAIWLFTIVLSITRGNIAGTDEGNSQEKVREVSPDEIVETIFKDNVITSEEVSVLVRWGPDIIPSLSKHADLGEIIELCSHANAISGDDLSKAQNAIDHFARSKGDLFICQALKHKSLTIREYALSRLRDSISIHAFGEVVSAYDFSLHEVNYNCDGEAVVVEKKNRERYLSILSDFLKAEKADVPISKDAEKDFVHFCKDWWGKNKERITRMSRKKLLDDLKGNQNPRGNE